MGGADPATGQDSERITPRFFVYAAAGVCVGLSDVWRFPVLLAEYQTLWFPIVYLAGLLLVGVPLLVAELALGRLGHSHPRANFGFNQPGHGAGPLWQYAGIIVLLAAFLILACATVVASWMLAYAAHSVVGSIGDFSDGMAWTTFYALVTSPERLLGWLTLLVVALGWIAAKDIDAGLGRFARRLVITLLVLGTLLSGLSLWKFGVGAILAVDGPLDWSQLSAGLVLDAVTQSFFTLGVGMGAMMILGHHLRSEVPLVPLVLGVVGIDMLFVGLAFAGIVPLVVSAGSAEGGIVLAMKTVPQAVSMVPASWLYRGLFYLLLFLLVIPTALVLMELLVAWLSEKTGKPRAMTAPVVAVAVWIGGVVAQLSFGSLAFDFEFVGQNKNFGLFDVMDILGSRILIPIIGLLMAIFVGWNIDKHAFAATVGNAWLASLFRALLRYVVPIVVGVIFIRLVFGEVLPLV